MAWAMAACKIPESISAIQTGQAELVAVPKIHGKNIASTTLQMAIMELLWVEELARVKPNLSGFTPYEDLAYKNKFVPAFGTKSKASENQYPI